jgi:hypothetical protein
MALTVMVRDVRFVLWFMCSGVIVRHGIRIRVENFEKDIIDDRLMKNGVPQTMISRRIWSDTISLSDYYRLQPVDLEQRADI